MGVVVIVVEFRVVLSDERPVFKLYFNCEFKCIMFE